MVAQVKSDPWKKGKVVTRRVFRLWPLSVWKRLLDDPWDRRAQLRIVTQANYALYGTIPHDLELLR